MRSSKQRQRNKQRQNRPTGGNIVNRVFDSSGPEGKVRGTPAQIIEKYTQLHRDAQLAGDRVGAENFAQHAEHYTRMLAEAQREIDRAREEQEQFNRDRQAERERQWERERADGRGDGRERPRFRSETDERAGERAGERASDRPAAEPSFLSQPLFPVLVAEPQDDAAPEAAGSGLVDTPEERAPERIRRDRPRRDERRAAEPEPAEAAAEPALAEADAPAEPAREPRARRPRRPRGPRPEAGAEVAPPDAAE